MIQSTLFKPSNKDVIVQLERRSPLPRLIIKSLLLYLFVLFSSVLADPLPEGFVNLKKEIPGIEIELRYASDDNFLGRPVEGYERVSCLITKEAAEALKKVQEELSAFGLGLKVFDAYRPQRAVDDFVVWAKDVEDRKMKAYYYPDVAKKDLFSQGYIAARSGHSRGSSVDLTIISSAKGVSKELDMGTAWDLFGPQSWGKDLSVTPQQRANRMLLQTLMQKYGFKALKEEWWHFTLVDEPFPKNYFDFIAK